MKTKLLKKIRRRFEIRKVHDYGPNDFPYLDRDFRMLSIPFYVIHDTTGITPHVGATQTYEQAFDKLINIVHSTYLHTKKSKMRDEKVYYVNKSKNER